MVVALNSLCQQGIRTLNYLDDWLVCAPTEQQARRDTEEVLTHIRRLDLTSHHLPELPHPFQNCNLSQAYLTQQTLI